MRKLYFVNPGEFDVTAMLTFGVSVKGESSIGYFGTGFKYAVAIIGRLGGTLRVTTKEESYQFSTLTKTVRGKEFQVVTMNGAEQGFTTHLGSKWEPWQAFRELYANCLDEGGKVTPNAHEAVGFDTVIEVSCKEISAAYDNRSKYFLMEEEPVAVLGSVEVYREPTEMYYYQGIAVATAPEMPYKFNLLDSVSLTEDRTASFVHWDIVRQITDSVQQCRDETVIRTLVTTNKSIEFNSSASASATFLNVCRELLDKGESLHPGALQVLRRTEKASKVWKELSLNPTQKMMLDKALKFLKEVIQVDIEGYPILFVEGLGQDVMGRAFEERIYLSEIPFNLGTKQVAGTILEEWVHLKFNCADFDRRMQNWLYDKIMSMGEVHQGSPV